MPICLKLHLKVPKELTCFFLILQFSSYFLNIVFQYICHHNKRTFKITLGKIVIQMGQISHTMWFYFHGFLSKNNMWHFFASVKSIWFEFNKYILPSILPSNYHQIVENRPTKAFSQLYCLSFALYRSTRSLLFQMSICPACSLKALMMMEFLQPPQAVSSSI